MKPESLVILIGTLGLVLAAYTILFIRFILEMTHETRWIRSLKKEELLDLEEQLDDCLQSAKIKLGSSSIDNVIKQQGYSIQEKPFMLFKEAYTTGNPVFGVYIRKSLTSARKHFALAHELIHIIYKQDDLDTHPLNRDIHSLFKIRDEREQKRDYMAASLILQKDNFWNELMDAHYFDITPQARKNFVYKSAQKYNVEPSMVFRRISELKVIMQ